MTGRWMTRVKEGLSQRDCPQREKRLYRVSRACSVPRTIDWTIVRFRLWRHLSVYKTCTLWFMAYTQHYIAGTTQRSDQCDLHTGPRLIVRHHPGVNLPASPSAATPHPYILFLLSSLIRISRSTYKPAESWYTQLQLAHGWGCCWRFVSLRYVTSLQQCPTDAFLLDGACSSSSSSLGCGSPPWSRWHNIEKHLIPHSRQFLTYFIYIDGSTRITKRSIFTHRMPC